VKAKARFTRVLVKESLPRRIAGWPFTGMGWVFFGMGWALLFVAGCFFQLGGDIAGESDEL
jgi:hypothetical protein